MKSAKQKKQELMRAMRKWVRHLRQDPYLAEDAKYLVVELHKWHGNDHALIRVRDIREPLVPYNNYFCGYTWVYMHRDPKRTVWSVYSELNRILVNMRHKRIGLKDFQ